MPSDIKKYSACFIFLGELKNDARTLNFARTLAKHNLPVCVIAYGESNEVKDFAKEGITLFPIRKSDNKRAWRRWLTFIFEARKYYKCSIAKTYWAEDVYTLIPARKLAKLHNGKLNYDSREIFSALGSLAKRKFKQNILSLIERRFIKYIDDIIVTSQLDSNYLKKYFHTSENFHIIMNLPPYKDRIKADLFREHYKIDNNTLLILYQGMIHEGRGLLPFVRALPYIDNANLCILGDGEYKKILDYEAKSLNVEDRVIFHGKVPYDELHRWTSSADVGIAFNEPISFSYTMALPNKLFEYCMARIPSIVSDLPALRPIIEEHNIGIILPSDATPEQIASELNQFKDKEIRKKYSEACEKATGIFCFEAQEEEILRMVK